MKIILACLFLFVTVVIAEPSNMPVSVFGGYIYGVSPSGARLRGTCGQAVAKRMTTPSDVLHAGFWPSQKAAAFSPVKEPQIALPAQIDFHAAYPNPFNPSTTISFSLPQTSDVKVELFDVTGRNVATLVNGKYVAGTHRLSWNATALASGTYFARLNAAGFSHTQKLQLIK